LFECFAVAVPSLFGLSVFFLSPWVVVCCLRDFCARSSRGKKEEEEVEERKEFVWCKEGSGRKEVGR